MNHEDKPLIYLYNVSKEFPTTGKSLDANLTAQIKEPMAQPIFYYPMYVSQWGSSLKASSSSLVLPLYFLSCISLPQFFPTPILTPSALIYRLPLVGLPWWWERLLKLVGPFWDIFLTKWGPPLPTDVTILKVAPTAKMVLNKQFPPRHYHYQSVQSSTYLWFLNWYGSLSTTRPNSSQAYKG